MSASTTQAVKGAVHGSRFGFASIFPCCVSSKNNEDSNSVAGADDGPTSRHSSKEDLNYLAKTLKKVL